MSSLFEALFNGYKNLLNRFGNCATDAYRVKKWSQFILNLGLVFLMMFIPTVGVAFLLLAIYKRRKQIFVLAMSASLVALLIASHLANRKKELPPPPPPPPQLPIGIVRANAKRAYHAMMQSAFLVLTELCQYLPGLVKPFSLASVEAPVHFDTTASMATLFHFIIGKGENDASVTAMMDILSSIISQHLQAQDLPISVPAVYTSMDGSTWPGLVVDGVYDLGHTYRVDLVITNEAMVTRLKARAASGLDGYDLGSQTVRDPDFD